MRKLYTLVFVRREASILLGFKKRGFGKGKWNGFGGKVEPGESIEEAAVRELHEECNLRVDKQNLNKIGILSFAFVETPDHLMEVHVFSTSDFNGEPEESEEMQPKWFGLDSIPFSEMWADDKHWFPIFLSGKKFVGDFTFEGQEKMLSQHLVEVNVFP